MADILAFPSKKLPEEVEIWVPGANGGEPNIITVPQPDMYWWFPILERTSVINPSMDGMVYYFTNPHGWENESYANRKYVLEISINRKTLNSILKALPYTLVTSFQSVLNDTDFALAHDNARIEIHEDVDISYELGLFISPTENPDKFRLTYVEC